MRIIFSTFLLATILFTGCKDRETRKVKDVTLNELPSDAVIGENEKAGSLHHKRDTLTSDEVRFIRQLSKENESITWAKQVDRYYNADSVLILSQLTSPETLLKDSGYVYFELKASGLITDAQITYQYSMGKADEGFGSVAGEGPENYIHSFKVCGVTNCLEFMYMNSRKIFERTHPIKDR